MPSETESDVPAAALRALHDKLAHALSQRGPHTPTTTHLRTAPLPALLDRRRELVLGVPDFWLTVLVSHPALSLGISGTDAAVLRHLVDVDVTTPTSGRTGDFSLTFTFARNAFVGACALTRAYATSDARGRVVTASPVKWLVQPPPQDLCFLDWLVHDTADAAHLGELIRDTIFPHAVALYFGTFPPLPHDEHADLTDLCAGRNPDASLSTLPL